MRVSKITKKKKTLLPTPNIWVASNYKKNEPNENVILQIPKKKMESKIIFIYLFVNVGHEQLNRNRQKKKKRTMNMNKLFVLWIFHLECCFYLFIYLLLLLYINIVLINWNKYTIIVNMTRYPRTTNRIRLAHFDVHRRSYLFNTLTSFCI